MKPSAYATAPNVGAAMKSGAVMPVDGSAPDGLIEGAMTRPSLQTAPTAARRRLRLAAKPQCADQCLITTIVVKLQVIEQGAALRDQL